MRQVRTSPCLFSIRHSKSVTRPSASSLRTISSRSPGSAQWMTAGPPSASLRVSPKISRNLGFASSISEPSCFVRNIPISALSNRSRYFFSLARRAASARLTSVMSLIIATTQNGSPSASRITVGTTSTGNRSPFLRMNVASMLASSDSISCANRRAFASRSSGGEKGCGMPRPTSSSREKPTMAQKAGLTSSWEPVGLRRQRPSFRRAARPSIKLTCGCRGSASKASSSSRTRRTSARDSPRERSPPAAGRFPAMPSYRHPRRQAEGFESAALPASLSVYCLSTRGPPQQDIDSEHAQAPSSLSAHEWTTWISRLQFSQTYTSPTFISLHDAIALTTFPIGL